MMISERCNSSSAKALWLFSLHNMPCLICLLRNYLGTHDISQFFLTEVPVYGSGSDNLLANE